VRTRERVWKAHRVVFCYLNAIIWSLNLKTVTTGCLQLLEILEISWNLIGLPGNFCVRCRRLTALVSSHKNMDKYWLQKYKIYRHQMCFFQVPDAPKPVFGRSSAPDPCGGAYNPPPDSYSAGESWNTHIMGIPALQRRPKQGKCPGFFLKSLLESPGNLLEICLIKFVDTLNHS